MIPYIKATISDKGDLGHFGPSNGPASLRVLLVQALQLLIFAVLAGVVLYQLYSVLGRRVGRQPGEESQAPLERPAPTPLSEPETAEAAAGLRAPGAATGADPLFCGPSRRDLAAGHPVPAGLLGRGLSDQPGSKKRLPGRLC